MNKIMGEVEGAKTSTHAKREGSVPVEMSNRRKLLEEMQPKKIQRTIGHYDVGNIAINKNAIQDGP